MRAPPITRAIPGNETGLLSLRCTITLTRRINIMKKVIVSRGIMGLCHMQVCCEANAMMIKKDFIS